MKPAKKTIETMRAYLENRRPKFELVKDGEFYCCTCERIKPLSAQTPRDRWTCKTCANRHKTNYRKKNWLAFLEFKRARNFRLKYGLMAPVMRTYLEVKKEIRKNEKIIGIRNAKHPVGNSRKVTK